MCVIIQIMVIFKIIFMLGRQLNKYIFGEFSFVAFQNDGTLYFLAFFLSSVVELVQCFLRREALALEISSGTCNFFIESKRSNQSTVNLFSFSQKCSIARISHQQNGNRNVHMVCQLSVHFFFSEKIPYRIGINLLHYKKFICCILLFLFVVACLNGISHQLSEIDPSPWL
uniref:Uncharacterized protein n=1 Tax=Heterorhabditis bacteriophora TaxID=37862 RepID=A0A1I7WGK4_HETBA